MQWIVIFLLTGVLGAQQAERGAGPRRPTTPLPSAAAIAEGRQLYNRSCTMCHGPDGAAGDRGPALAASRRYLRSSEEDLIDAIKNGIRGTMMPPSPMPGADIRKVAGYIRSLRATAFDVAVEGDAARGGEIFWGKAGCGKCHMIGGKGGLLGPDLSNIGGERRLDAIRDSLTKPRAQIGRAYQPVRMVTPDGRVVEGIIKNENNFSLQVLDREYKLHLVDRTELKEISYGKESLMPADWDRRLTKGEFQDLLAYLSRQARDREGR